MGTHHQNLKALQDIADRLTQLNHTVDSLAQTVTKMQPIVDAWQVSRWKLAGAAGFGLLLLTPLVWILEVTLKSFIMGIWAKLH